MDQCTTDLEKERKDEGKVERKAKRAKAERKEKVNGKERAKEIGKARKERKVIGKERKETGKETGKEKAMHPKAIGKVERKEARHRAVQESNVHGIRRSTMEATNVSSETGASTCMRNVPHKNMQRCKN